MLQTFKDILKSLDRKIPLQRPTSLQRLHFAFMIDFKIVLFEAFHGHIPVCLKMFQTALSGHLETVCSTF